MPRRRIWRARARPSSDPEKRKEIYFRIQEIHSEDSPMLPLYYTPYVNVTTARVHNFNHPPTGAIRLEVDLDRAID